MNFHATKLLADEIIEFSRLCNIIKDTVIPSTVQYGPNSVHNFFSSSGMRIDLRLYNDGSIDYAFSYRGANFCTWERVDVALNQHGNSYVYNYSSSSGSYVAFKYTNMGSDEMEYIATYQPIENITIPVLKLCECTEEMYEQLQYLHPNEIVHSLFIVSLMQAYGVIGIFNTNTVEGDDMNTINKKLRMVHDA